MALVLERLPVVERRDEFCWPVTEGLPVTVGNRAEREILTAATA